MPKLKPKSNTGFKKRNWDDLQRLLDVAFSDKQFTKGMVLFFDEYNIPREEIESALLEAGYTIEPVNHERPVIRVK